MIVKSIQITIFLSFVFFSITSFAQKARFISETEGGVVKVIKLKEDYQSAGMVYIPSAHLGYFSNPSLSFNRLVIVNKADTVFVGIDSGYYKSNTEEILTYLEKKGYKSHTQVVTLEQVRASKKRVILGKLEKLPLRTSDDAHIVIKQVDIKVKRKAFTKIYYDSYSDFLSKKIETTSFSSEDFNVENSVLSDDLNNMLIKTGHIDTINKLNMSIYDRIKLNIVITGITEHKFSNFCVVELKSTIKFGSFYAGAGEVEKEYITFSSPGYDFSRENQSNSGDLIEDALENLFITMLKDPALERNFKNPEKALKNMTDSLSELVLFNKSTEASNLENASAAVVTVLRKNGHGSGCMISNDGYVVTNFHVVGADTSDIYMVFNTGAKKRCSFVRGNAMYDLALLKVDTVITTPLRINASKTINIGADIYAIGTPRDISLGQSITRGIISAKRTIDNKIFIQSDVSVSGGNSGGGMISKEGMLIGIVNAKLVGQGVEGVSFAIPAYYIEEFLRIKVVK